MNKQMKKILILIVSSFASLMFIINVIANQNDEIYVWHMETAREKENIPTIKINAENLFNGFCNLANKVVNYGEKGLCDVLGVDEGFDEKRNKEIETNIGAISLSDIPDYNGQPYVVINNNVPDILEDEFTTDIFYELSEFDDYGRCGKAYGCFGRESIAEGERGSIGHVKPSGWHTVKYIDVIEDNYLYNRCHLLMWKLSGVLDDERNLITGTRYLNVQGMLPFEEIMIEYIEKTENHVMYSVTPVFRDNELVARGVHMEAASVEDYARGLSFNVYCYNVQPGITIDYVTGESWISEGEEVKK